MAPNAKFTEQTQVLKVGEGLWRTATEGPTTFKVAAADPVAGQITAPSQLGNLQAPRAPLLADVSPADRSARDLMLLIGNSYYDALMQSDGRSRRSPQTAGAARTGCTPRVSAVRRTRHRHPASRLRPAASAFRDVPSSSTRAR